jgi:hypothetical protein
MVEPCGRWSQAFRGATHVDVCMWRMWLLQVCLAAFLGSGGSTVGDLTGKRVKDAENATADFME